MRTDSSVARATSITSCVWQAPPSPSLSFRTLRDTNEEGEKEEYPSDDEEDDEDEDDDEDEETSDEVQERHMFDLARRQVILPSRLFPRTIRSGQRFIRAVRGAPAHVGRPAHCHALRADAGPQVHQVHLLVAHQRKRLTAHDSG